jgi:hypothetical protein
MYLGVARATCEARWASEKLALAYAGVATIAKSLARHEISSASSIG